MNNSAQILEAGRELNEAEVRFHFIDPILRKLGYDNSKGNYLFLEEKLPYPYFHIGRRSKKDVPLGFPDYRCGIDGRRGSFIIEAKKSSHVISDLDREQGHSYAAHAHVGANYFVLCNGWVFQIYATLSGPTKSPICEISFDKITARFHEIEAILGPTMLQKNSLVEYDSQLPLAKGYASSFDISNGSYELSDFVHTFTTSNSLIQNLVDSNPAVLKQIADARSQILSFIFTVEAGKCYRGEDGRLIADISFGPLTKNNRDTLKLLNADRMIFYSNDEQFSTDALQPTVLEAENKAFLTKGTALAPLIGEAVPADQDIEINYFVTVSAHLAGESLIGEFGCFADYRMTLPQIGPLTLEADFYGNFKLKFWA